MALKNNVDYVQCLGMVREARSKGLTVPVLLMGEPSVSAVRMAAAYHYHFFRLLQPDHCVRRGEGHPRCG